MSGNAHQGLSSLGGGTYSTSNFGLGGATGNNMASTASINYQTVNKSGMGSYGDYASNASSQSNNVQPKFGQQKASSVNMDKKSIMDDPQFLRRKIDQLEQENADLKK